jgi:flagellar motor component MotA
LKKKRLIKLIFKLQDKINDQQDTINLYLKILEELRLKGIVDNENNIITKEG